MRRNEINRVPQAAALGFRNPGGFAKLKEEDLQNYHFQANLGSLRSSYMTEMNNRVFNQKMRESSKVIQIIEEDVRTRVCSWAQGGNK